MKWLRGFTILLVFLGISVCSSISNVALASNFSIESEWHHITVGYNYKSLGSLNDKLTFQVTGNYMQSELSVVSSKKDVKKLILEYPIYSPKVSLMPLNFYVKAITDNTTGKHFWVILAREGNKVIGWGLWIVGEHNGQYVTYISEQGLNAMGWKRPVNRSTRNGITTENGDLYIQFTEVYRDSSLPEYKTNINVNPVTFKLFWDEKANWFGVERVYTALPNSVMYH